MDGGRFPFGPFPKGWFWVAWSRELARGAVRPLHYLGRDLVLWRGDDGVARLFDAHCIHLGAHLGVGGRLVEGQLQCPFHGWRYGADGACTTVPGTRRVPPGARVWSWTVREWCGALLGWHGSETPEWQPPEVPEHGAREWTAMRRASGWEIRSHPHEFEENGMDLAHFPFLHSQQTREMRSERAVGEGPVFTHLTWQRYSIFGLARLFVSEVTGPLEVQLVGPGIAINRAAVRAGAELAYLFLFFFTPIDGQRVAMRSAIAMRRFGGPLVEWLLLRKAIREGARTIEQDIPIWENKLYRERPLLSDADGPIMLYRRWARQFYAEPAGIEPAQSSSGSTARRSAG